MGGQRETPEGTWSVAINTDAEHRYRCFRSTPLQARLPYRLRSGSGNPFIHEFRDFRPECRPIYPPSVHHGAGRVSRGCTRKGPTRAHTKTPEGTRSLVAPTNVNTSQITRCSCPFEQRERYGAPHHRGKVVIHEIHRKHIVFEGVVHTLPTLRLERPRDVVGQQRSPVIADREAPLVGAVHVAQVPGVTSGALHVPARRSGIERIVDP